MNKDALIQAIAAKTDMSKKDVETVVDTMIDVITNSVRQNQKVTFTGFGTFKLSKRAARQGINPQTKAKIQIPAMSIPKFTAGKAFKDAVR